MQLAIRSVLLFLIACYGLQAGAGRDENLSNAAAVAEEFLAALDNGDYSRAYKFTGKQYKGRVEIDQFVLSFHRIRLELGGIVFDKPILREPFERALLENRKLNKIKGSDEIGEYYFLRYAAIYKGGRIREDIYLQKEDDEKWHVVGAWFEPYY